MARAYRPVVVALLAGLVGALGSVQAQAAPSPRTVISGVGHPIRFAPAPRGYARPQALTASGSPTGYIPCDVWNAYRLPGLGGGAADGTGTTIAIIDTHDQPTIVSDLHSFDQAFGLPDPTLTKVKLGSPPNNVDNWQDEITLDVEWAHAAAPGAAIVLIETETAELSYPPSGSDLTAGLQYAVNTVRAGIISMSWGAPESVFPNAATEGTFNQLLPSLNGAGVPVAYFASTGDFGFGTNWPAIAPTATGVGGTSVLPSAFGYTSAPGSHTDCSLAAGTPGVTAANETTWSNGCGASTCIGTGGGPSAFEPAPGWQSATVAGVRESPDVSMLADPNTGVALFENGAWQPVQFGGTSLSAPLWAGVAARLDQQRASLGLPNLGVNGTSHWAYSVPGGDFNDIVQGSSPAVPGDPCVTGGTCAARAGYDEVTGRGSPLWPALGNDLGGSGSRPRSNLVAIPPKRVLDTRDDTGGKPGPFQQGQTYTLTSDKIPVPAGTTALVVNVTATDVGGGAGYVLLYPCNTTPPFSSTLNYFFGQTIAILTQVALGPGGCLNIFTNTGPENVILDLEGYFTATPANATAGLLSPLAAPYRAMDTRTGLNTAPGPLPGGAPGREFQVDGNAGLLTGPPIPAEAGSVVLNLTAVDGTAPLSYLSVYPAAAGPAPCPANQSTSNLNFPAGRALANRVTVSVGAGGSICIYNNSGTADAVIDLIGWYSGGSGADITGLGFTPFSPNRVYDSRLVAPIGPGSGCPQASITLTEPVAMKAISFNLTGLDATQPTYLEVYPGGQPPASATSDVNLAPGDILPNLVISGLGGGQTIALCNFQGRADFFADLNGGYS